jgi:hypothetical protein
MEFPLERYRAPVLLLLWKLDPVLSVIFPEETDISSEKEVAFVFIAMSLEEILICPVEPTVLDPERRLISPPFELSRYVGPATRWMFPPLPPSDDPLCNRISPPCPAGLPVSDDKATNVIVNDIKTNSVSVTYLQ